MDVLDHLSDRPQCGLCSRPVRWSDDFCSRCRQVLPEPRQRLRVDERMVVVEAEAILLAAS
jgi:predicted nucleic acid-binding Zn ribbon protein